ncbi:TadE/TadG family type IV pilus assembly protein [Parasphingorhabdus sp.]|uniref:TadE/TadG family type IV pilus assembly protein n=1 Tax=Parasphingorhabdus sp. TaxID=2709688 RepID=UPI0035935E3F
MYLNKKSSDRKASGFVRRTLAAVAVNTSGLALIEFAYALPLLLGVGMYGAEVANIAMVRMRINQISMHAADNAARIGEGSLLSQKKIYESDINDLFVGANLQAGEYVDIFEHGRVIISSLERHSDGDQYINWQRCKGKKAHVSSYGTAGANSPSRPINGMGPSGARVTAPANQAVIFVEISYDYQPLISRSFTNTRTITTRSAFNVRDRRDLTQIYNRTGSDPVSGCNTYNGIS